MSEKLILVKTSWVHRTLLYLLLLHIEADVTEAQ